MTKPGPITLPCTCHVPPPEGTVRCEVRKAKKDEWYWSESEHKWRKSDKDFCFLEVIVAIIEPQYDYPTPVEACRLLAEAGKYVLCEFLSTHSVWCSGKLRWIELEQSGVVPMPYCILNYGWVSKIRIPKRG